MRLKDSAEEEGDDRSIVAPPLVCELEPVEHKQSPDDDAVVSDLLANRQVDASCLMVFEPGANESGKKCKCAHKAKVERSGNGSIVIFTYRRGAHDSLWNKPCTYRTLISECLRPLTLHSSLDAGHGVCSHVEPSFKLHGANVGSRPGYHGRCE